MCRNTTNKLQETTRNNKHEKTTNNKQTRQTTNNATNKTKMTNKNNQQQTDIVADGTLDEGDVIEHVGHNNRQAEMRLGCQQVFNKNKYK